MEDNAIIKFFWGDGHDLKHTNQKQIKVKGIKKDI